jgi:hypothetical protein
MIRVRLLAYALVLTMFVFSSSAGAEDLPVPEGWRLPTEAEASKKWGPEGLRAYLSIDDADFDGDGNPDRVRILVPEEGTGIGLFVFLAQDGSFRTMLLNAVEGSAWMRVMGISTVPPGEYVTACGKAYWECREDEPRRIIFSRPGILYFMADGERSVFYWNGTEKTFNHIRIIY